ncbi:MAG TPA: amidohydrolase family protein [Puia sp.]|jgi:cytosine/adenosine deaminase-related metal-dependent hydrolase|nr:amidohydrolase family protein [Puia sp.]
MLTYSTRTIGLIGFVWMPDGKERLQTLVIEKGKIVRVIEGKATEGAGGLSDFPGIIMIELDAETVIFPGLLNLHTHIGYNILPVWESHQVWKNRFQWRSNSAYKQQIGGLLDYIKEGWKEDAEVKATLAQVAGATAAATATSPQVAGIIPTSLPQVDLAHAIISEIQAVAGGTVVIQETLDLDKEQADDRSFIIRNTGDQAGLPIPAADEVNSVVDFYRPNVTPSGDSAEDTSNWAPVAQSTYNSYIRSVNNNNTPYYATLIHVGEGKTGFVKGSTADPYSRKEVDLLFGSLQKDVGDPGKLTQSRLGITHGCGMDPGNAAWVDFVKTHQISWIWSPVSNLLLYRDTLDVRRLLDKGINVCLGSDWSPSGSKHVLDELKFARFVNQLLDLQIGDRELFRMVTANPAQALGLMGNGTIREGGNADLFVLRRSGKEDDPLTALLESGDAAIDFVMVNGRIVFGLTRYFENELKVDYQGFPPEEGEAVARRGVSINSEINFDLVRSLKIMDTLLERYGSTVLHEPALRRTRMMAADDEVYRRRIGALRDELMHLYW